MDNGNELKTFIQGKLRKVRSRLTAHLLRQELVEANGLKPFELTVHFAEKVR